MLIDRNDLPKHLFGVPDLDLSDDLCAERLAGPWFRLGACSTGSGRDKQRVENVVYRQSMLLSPEDFSVIFDKLESIVGDIGKPGGSLIGDGDKRVYRYSPFHRFEISFTRAAVEPLVFFNPTGADTSLLINPDLWLFLKLEEKASGIWWDPPKGVEAVRQLVIEPGELEIVEILVEYLSKYLRARQMALLVQHIRSLQISNPPQEMIDRFEEGTVTMGSAGQGVKAIVNSDHRDDLLVGDPFLLRTLRLWFEIKPLAIDIEDPWAEEPQFDPYTFTLPTQAGPVAPARWGYFRQIAGRKFDGVTCDFMEPVFFRQEVLAKYEGSSGFDVADNGSVSCNGEWGLTRSTWRIGNELLATAIGDFAQGVPFHEWPHWQENAVEPPSSKTVAVLKQEQTVADAVNSLVQALGGLNRAFIGLASSLGMDIPGQLWSGSLNSLACRQLKWVYPTTADDNEFLKRATLACTLVIDALGEKLLRKLLQGLDGTLHQNNDNPPKTLGYRRLLQRVTLVAVLMENLRPNIVEIPSLVRRAEGEAASAEDDLPAEIEKLYKHVRDEFVPLAFLYDLRVHGGLAHHPNIKEAAKAAKALGLPASDWHRTHYLSLLNLLTRSISQISEHLRSGAS